MVAVRFSALAAGAPAARVTARRAFRVAARVFDSCPDEPRASRALRRAVAVACERIVAVVAITERSVARVGCGYNPDGVARGACPACANLRGRKAAKAMACHRFSRFVIFTSPAGFASSRELSNCHALLARVLTICLTVQNARIKNRTRGRPSADGALSHHQLSTPKSERTKARHIERTTRASLARGNRLDGRISRRAPPRGRRRPPRVPRAPTPSTDERPPTARRVRASRESPGARRPGARVLRGGAGRRGRPKRKLRDTRGHRRRLPRGCAPVERRLPATSPVIFPAKNAPPAKPPPKNRLPASQDETSVSPRPRPARSHRLGHRHVLAVSPAPERHLPHHPVRGARRREGDPRGARRSRSVSIVVAVALVRFVGRRPQRRQPGVPQGGIHRVPRGVRRAGRRGYRREGAQLRFHDRRRRRSAARRPRAAPRSRTPPTTSTTTRSRRCATCGTRGCAGPCTACRRRTTPRTSR